MADLLDSQPFVLLDDARPSGASPARLYQSPVETISAVDPAEVPIALRQLKAARDKGLHAAGFITYDAGYALEPKLSDEKIWTAYSNKPLLWFGLFSEFTHIAAEDVPNWLPDPAGGWAGRPRSSIDHDAYANALAEVQSLIAAGDIYQANLTFNNHVSTAGHPLAVYAGLRSRAKAGYGGVVWTGEDWLLSLSPELFFALQDGKVTTKPMKGTATRGADAAADATEIAALQADPKQRAENLMIVDLLRNDLSRVAKPGTVMVPHLFSVETYPTLHQMTSTVTAQLRNGVDAVDLIASIFPCGSITGAPKIRAMEILSDVEAEPRGIYTGSIGRIDIGGDAAFNVAIRTLHLQADDPTASLGLGSGIVADSNLGQEWDECRAKGKFVGDHRRFDLIETMRFEPEAGILMLDRHLARMKASARALDFEFDAHSARNDLQASTFRLTGPKRIRLMLARSGQIAVEITAVPAPPMAPVPIGTTALPVHPADFRLRHKTSDRSFYDTARALAGTFDVILVDLDGYLTEGCFTSVFVERDGILLTPPLSRGLLPGILREALIADRRAVEADLRVSDLTSGFFIGNASRGLMPAVLTQS
jgi:para-aminobenzoate synthetase / 4-amino-4-deoxychorismate lyase